MNRDKNICSAFKDLYPSYIDGMIEDETRLWMDKHIQQCEDCCIWIKSYKGDSDLKETSHIIQVDTSTFEEDKKAIKKARIFIALGLVAVIMLAIWTSIWIFV
ncbi:zf-HC2 domain-containing protein [Clostridium tagluense]|uniref:zf-HC2 domain-containing protein n=1 Tax=Clostridium tagluense TaxID=360422 RepID=UPI001C6E2DDF|nr:zf-HC2 domain-containing protein [Clostridium tagluense]MBW9155474.1 zf-HC2 domain-containing protein [Clostridium tagluense]WLC66105.1 zf-HC2 domain-containing protein [Clostridium tagluense]